MLAAQEMRALDTTPYWGGYKFDCAVAKLLELIAKDIDAWQGYMPDQTTTVKVHKQASRIAKMVFNNEGGTND